MKALFFLTLASAMSVALAGPIPSDPNLDLQIGCESNGLDSFGKPLKDSASFSLKFKPIKKEGGPSTEDYSIEVIKKTVGEPARTETSFVKMKYYPIAKGQFAFKFIALTAPNFDQSTGRFTSHGIAQLSPFAPFIIYGWSKVPKTVETAIEYRCIIEAVL